MRTIRIKYFNQNIDKITKLKQGDWIDLRCAEQNIYYEDNSETPLRGIKIKKGEALLVKLGVGMILPEGYEAHLAPRSSTFKKYKVLLTNSVGVIDESYCGEEDEWKASFYATEDTFIPFNERICQFRIMEKQPELNFVEVEHLNAESRGGFGSTGVN